MSETKICMVKGGEKRFRIGCAVLIVTVASLLLTAFLSVGTLTAAAERNIAGLSLTADAQPSDLETALAGYADYSERNDLLKLDMYANRLENNSDGLQPEHLAFMRESASITDAAEFGGSARITNDYIEAAKLTAGGEEIGLSGVPMLYRTKLTFKDVGSTAWNGGGITLGRTAEGFTVNFRILANGNTAFNLKNNQTNDSIDSVTFGESFAAVKGNSFILAVIRDGSKYDFFADGAHKGSFTMPAASPAQNFGTEIDKAFIGVYSCYAQVTTAETSLIPLVDVKLPMAQMPEADSVLSETELKLDKSDDFTETKASSKVTDGKLWRKISGSSWQYEQVSEYEFTAFWQGTLSVAAFDSGYTVDFVFKRSDDKEFFLRFNGSVVQLVSGGGNAERILASGAVDLSVPFPFLLFASKEKVTLNFNQTSVVSEYIDADGFGNVAELRARHAETSIDGLKMVYGSDVFITRPDDNSYVDPGPAKGTPNTSNVKNAGGKMPGGTVALIVCGSVLIAGAAAAAVLLFIGGKKKISRNKGE